MFLKFSDKLYVLKITTDKKLPLCLSVAFGILVPKRNDRFGCGFLFENKFSNDCFLADDDTLLTRLNYSDS